MHALLEIVLLLVDLIAGPGVLGLPGFEFCLTDHGMLYDRSIALVGATIRIHALALLLVSVPAHWPVTAEAQPLVQKSLA